MRTGIVLVSVLLTACTAAPSSSPELTELRQLRSEVDGLCRGLPAWAQMMLSQDDNVMIPRVVVAAVWFGPLCPGMAEVAQTISDASIGRLDRSQIRQALVDISQR